MTAAHQGNLWEITTSQQARSAAPTACVKRVGTDFIRDHRTLDAGITKTAAQHRPPRPKGSWRRGVLCRGDPPLRRGATGEVPRAHAHPSTPPPARPGLSGQAAATRPGSRSPAAPAPRSAGAGWGPPRSTSCPRPGPDP
ncbi:hypothetical protein ACH40D_42190 [Streptomyces olivaceoviridis]|uniref:hypothetical protein n=1 Tax=Streptomyces TaxID=1883 RepID=UPI0037B83BF0